MDPCVLGRVASALAIAQNISYMWSLKKDPPNPIVVLLMACWAFTNASTYTAFNDPCFSLLAKVQAAVVIGPFGLVLLRTRQLGWARVRARIRFDCIDVAVVIMCVLSLVAWKLTSAQYGNIVGQLAAAIIFVSVTKQAWVSTDSMSQWPWLLGIASYIVQLFATLGGNSFSLVYPVAGILRYIPVLLGIWIMPHHAPSEVRTEEKIP